MAKMDIKARTEICSKDSCVEYVIVNINGKTVQGHHVYFLVNRVNIFLQGKVQKVAPTSPMQVSTDESITQSLESLVVNVIHVGNCWFSGVNDIHCRNDIYYVKEFKRWQEPKRLAC